MRSGRPRPPRPIWSRPWTGNGISCSMLNAVQDEKCCSERELRAGSGIRSRGFSMDSAESTGAPEPSRAEPSRSQPSPVPPRRVPLSSGGVSP
ncbi:hypothetical protein SLNWT_5172 [Streptomyces albus]|uniref:Uncharacterized protein n=1 Tax=Streptomyces albus (strain ATCC 21838 / DSM 41398 / FERM P-419 / JCM 4703 / NBRC 107858) TaxID=1081613 RepID=A0A0B5ERU2_STRA4|nr:hypothetical protein SLNWT_5172 [Streptomyces albus]AOU79852.1 hypothetical protein SLNHY_5161 [Streptomyces albus]AYN35576.1 hypothetical protein DUI70_5077 [Streptomyces albus]